MLQTDLPIPHFNDSRQLRLPPHARAGLQWQLYPVDFKTEEGTLSVYLYAINREHAATILLELKETAVLRDGDLDGITRND